MTLIEHQAPDVQVPSDRQLEILKLIADGMRTEDIADKLCLSPETVRTHVKRTISRLGATNRPHAVAKALRLGMMH